MEKYLALLRGVNVGGKNVIKMNDLKIILESNKFKDVQTYIQSGNIIFDYKKVNPIIIEKEIASIILSEFGFEVPLVVLNANEFETILNNNIYLKNFDHSLIHITFLANKIEEDLLKNVIMDINNTDEFKIIDKAIYLFIPNGYGNTKYNNNFFEKKLKVLATTRNLKTCNTLLNMLSEKLS